MLEQEKIVLGDGSLLTPLSLTTEVALRFVGGDVDELEFELGDLADLLASAGLLHGVGHVTKQEVLVMMQLLSGEINKENSPITKIPVESISKFYQVGEKPPSVGLCQCVPK